MTTYTPPAAMVERAALADARARRGPTAKVNDTDREGARAALLAAHPVITTAEEMLALPDRARLFYPALNTTHLAKDARHWWEPIASDPAILIFNPEDVAS